VNVRSTETQPRRRGRAAFAEPFTCRRWRRVRHDDPSRPHDRSAATIPRMAACREQRPEHASKPGRAAIQPRSWIMAWTREELDAALEKLDRDIEPMLASGDAAQFWSAFKREATRIEQSADRHFWYAAARLNHLVIAHRLIPRVQAMRVALRREERAGAQRSAA
jgi:hypothetical protein